MGNSNTANRPSQSDQEYVRNSEGKLVRNIAFKGKAGSGRQNSSSNDIRGSIIQDKQETVGVNDIRVSDKQLADGMSKLAERAAGSGETRIPVVTEVEDGFTNVKYKIGNHTHVFQCDGRADGLTDGFDYEYADEGGEGVPEIEYYGTDSEFNGYLTPKAGTADAWADKADSLSTAVPPEYAGPVTSEHQMNESAVNSYSDIADSLKPGDKAEFVTEYDDKTQQVKATVFVNGERSEYLLGDDDGNVGGVFNYEDDPSVLESNNIMYSGTKSRYTGYISRNSSTRGKLSDMKNEIDG